MEEGDLQSIGGICRTFLTGQNYRDGDQIWVPRVEDGGRGSGRGGWMDMFVVMEVPVSRLGWWVQKPTNV